MDFGWDLQENKETRAGINVVYKELDKIMRERRQKGADERVGVKLKCEITILNACHIRYFHWWIKAEIGEQINSN